MSQRLGDLLVKEKVITTEHTEVHGGNLRILNRRSNGRVTLCSSVPPAVEPSTLLSPRL